MLISIMQGSFLGRFCQGLAFWKNFWLENQFWEFWQKKSFLEIILKKRFLVKKFENETSFWKKFFEKHFQASKLSKHSFKIVKISFKTTSLFKKVNSNLVKLNFDKIKIFKNSFKCLNSILKVSQKFKKFLKSFFSLNNENFPKNSKNSKVFDKKKLSNLSLKKFPLRPQFSTILIKRNETQKVNV